MSDIEWIRSTIARHADRTAESLHPRLRLDVDLDMTPLELVLITIEIEDEMGISVPVDSLAQVETVGELLDFFRRLVRHGRLKALPSVA